jgi:eukaryotic-like serine/threonine-protein kinase
VDAEAIAGRYRREELLGSGGMSEVWAAHDLELDRKVAVKLLAPGADRVRFEREARAAASLSHPNICQVFDYGEAEGRPYIVLEYLPGGTLEERLPPGRPLPEAEARRIAAELAAGLAHAHERGVVHRDLKPSNVLFGADGRARIADFGIARLDEEGTITEAGTVLGTAAYLSPEQAAGAPATAASDVYSFGVVLYRLLSGRLPFEGSSPLELALAHRDQAPPPPADVSAPLAGLAMRCLSKSPGERPADGAALLAALGGKAAPEEATRVIPWRERHPQQRPRRRRRLLLAVVVAAALLAAGVAVAFVTTGGSGPSAPSTTTGPASTRTAPPPTTTTPTQRESTAAQPSTSTMTTATTTEATTTAPETTTPTEPTTTDQATAPSTTVPFPPPPATTTAPVTTAPPPPPTSTDMTTTEPTTTEPPPPTTTAETTTEPPPTTDTTPVATTEPATTSTGPSP